MLSLIKKRSPTGRVGSGSSGGARKSRLVSLDSAHQAQLLGVGGYNLAPMGHIFLSRKLPLKKYKFLRSENSK
jgi:hypothetical protein